MTYLLPDYLSFSPFKPVEQTDGKKGILKPQVKRAFVKQRLLTKAEVEEGYIYTPVRTGYNSNLHERWLLVISSSLEPVLKEASETGTLVNGIETITSFQETIDGKFAVVKPNPNPIL